MAQPTPFPAAEPSPDRPSAPSGKGGGPSPVRTPAPFPGPERRYVDGAEGPSDPSGYDISHGQIRIRSPEGGGIETYEFDGMRYACEAIIREASRRAAGEPPRIGHNAERLLARVARGLIIDSGVRAASRISAQAVAVACCDVAGSKPAQFSLKRRLYDAAADARDKKKKKKTDEEDDEDRDEQPAKDPALADLAAAHSDLADVIDFHPEKPLADTAELRRATTFSTARGAMPFRAKGLSGELVRLYAPIAGGLLPVIRRGRVVAQYIEGMQMLLRFGDKTVTIKFTPSKERYIGLFLAATLQTFDSASSASACLQEHLRGEVRSVNDHALLGTRLADCLSRVLHGVRHPESPGDAMMEVFAGDPSEYAEVAAGLLASWRKGGRAQ